MTARIDVTKAKIISESALLQMGYKPEWQENTPVRVYRRIVCKGCTFFATRKRENGLTFIEMNPY